MKTISSAAFLCVLLAITVALFGRTAQAQRKELPSAEVAPDRPKVPEVTLPVASKNWDRFHGPNGAGAVSGMDFPTSFSATQNVLWKTPLPGEGNSSPIVWADRLFVQSSSTDGGERFLVCLNARSGQALWSRTLPGTKAKTHEKNTLASSTPACDGENVYVSVWDGKAVQVLAYSFGGEFRWKQDLGEFVSEHGFAASPVVHKNLVYFSFDSDKKASLTAFNKKSGDIAWQAGRKPFRASYSAPFVRITAGVADELVLVSTAAVTSYESATGAVLWEWNWKFPGKPLRTIASPVLVNDTLVVCAGDGSSGERFTCGIGLSGQGNETKATLAWETKKDVPYITSPVSRGEYVYIANDPGFLGCYEAKTGKKVWYERMADAFFIASPVLVGDRLVICSEEGDVYVCRAEPRFELLAKNDLGEMIRATPAVADGRLYIRGRSHLYCIGKSQPG